MEYGTTAGGKPITEEVVDQLAAKAEDGFDVDETMQRRRMKVWYCKIGEVPGDQLPDGADQAMRTAVEDAYFDLVGNNEFIFSGWGAQLTESERAVVEDREPDMAAVVREACAGLPWDTLREKIAEAIYNRPAEREGRVSTRQPWASAHSTTREVCLDMADAALAVLREGRL